jgi:signal transduction histidine kinase
MKIVGGLSLRMRITLLAGIILILCSIILTIASSYNARSQFSTLTLSNAIPVKDIMLKEGTAISAVGTPVTLTPSAFTTAKKQFDSTGMIILVIVSILGMGMVYVVAGRSLRPISKLSETVCAITEDNLQQRIPEEIRNDEVGALGHSFNTMLDRLEKSFLRQKRFSANVAHELKTPLATINAGIQVLHLDENPSISDYEETLASTERNVNRLMAVVDDLMRLCDEQEEFNTSSVDLQEMFESICSELYPVLEEKNIGIILQCGLQSVYGSQVLLYRACFNLVENAAKYNKESGKILIETIIDGRTGRIVITDTGNGIPADELQQIFEPFYRVNKSRSRKAGGAGLGLSIVKTIVEKHGWEISVNSVLGQGSTFTIMLG